MTVSKKADPLDPNVDWYIVSWDQLGVEHLQNITGYHPEAWAKQHLFNSIQKSEAMPENPLSAMISRMVLRARFNNHRHYEIYIFQSTNDISFNDIKAWTEEDPQGFANFVREHHAMKLFDDRAKPNNIKIT